MALLEFYTGFYSILGGYIIIPLHSLMPTKSQQQVFLCISYLIRFRCQIRCIILYKPKVLLYRFMLVLLGSLGKHFIQFCRLTYLAIDVYRFCLLRDSPMNKIKQT